MSSVASRNIGDRGSLSVVKLANVLDRPRETVIPLIRFLGLTQTQVTEGQLTRISREEEREVTNQTLNEVEREELLAVKKIYHNLDMPVQQIDRLLFDEVA
jgi:hypothetical protein